MDLIILLLFHRWVRFFFFFSMTFYDGRYPSHPHKAAINAYRLRSNKEFRKKNNWKRFNELSLPVSLLPILTAINVPRFYEERETNLQNITLFDAL